MATNDSIRDATREGPLNLRRLEVLARACLPPEVFAYIAGGAADERTVAENCAAYERVALLPRVLVDVATRDAAIELLGQPMSAPWLIAPTAMHALVHRDAELATARAAASCGITMVCSTLSTTPIEAVARACSDALWFQLYVYRDRGATAELVARVQQAGVRALVVTVDAPLLGLRERDHAHGVGMPAGFRAPNVRADGDVDAAHLGDYFAALVDPSLSWRDLEWLRSITTLPIVLKGVLRADDAGQAAAAGVAGIVVSNHGGRQLDGAIATFDALPAVRAAVGDRVAVLVDGGIRRGTDVLKALACGADAVQLGRPILWALASGGERAVVAALRQLHHEFDLAMALCGCPRIDAIDASLLAR